MKNIKIIVATIVAFAIIGLNLNKENTYDKIEVQENKLINQVTSLEYLQDQFKDFGISSTSEDKKGYKIVLTDNTVLKYEKKFDMFYVNELDFECMNDTKNYLIDNNTQIIEYNNDAVRISNATFNEIFEGENSDLQGSLYIDDSEILEVVECR